jgi:hypothetical protein
MPFTAKLSPQGLELRGLIDETAVFPAPPLGRMPLAVNLRQVTGINSPGVVRFLNFVDTWMGRPVEYHQCPMAFVDAMLMLPALLGPEGRTARIKSLQVPFSCSKCAENAYLYVQDSDVRVEDDLLVLAPRACTRCGGQMICAEAVQEFMVLVEVGALVPKP